MKFDSKREGDALRDLMEVFFAVLILLALSVPVTVFFGLFDWIKDDQPILWGRTVIPLVLAPVVLGFSVRGLKWADKGRTRSLLQRIGFTDWNAWVLAELFCWILFCYAVSFFTNEVLTLPHLVLYGPKLSWMREGLSAGLVLIILVASLIGSTVIGKRFDRQARLRHFSKFNRIFSSSHD